MSKVNELFQSEMSVVNIGIESFYHDLSKQDKPVVHVEWKPVAGGDKELADMLSMLM